MGVCVNCGGALEDRWKFCIFCGTPVSASPTSDPAPKPVTEPDAGAPSDAPGAVTDAGAEPEPEPEPEPERASEPVGPPDAVPSDEREPGPDAASDEEPAVAPGPARPPIPSAIRTFVPVEIPNEDDDEPASGQIRPRFRQRRVDVPLMLGIALGVAGVVLVVYIIVVLSGQG